MNYNLFKVNDNTYRITVGNKGSSMLSRYGILGGEDTRIEDCEDLNICGSRVAFFAKRRVDIEVFGGESGHSYVIPLRDGERIFGLGDANREEVMIRSRRITLHKANVSCYGPMPIILSNDGWALFVNTTYSTIFDVGAAKPDELRIEVDGGGVDFYLFKADTLLGLTKSLTLITGRPMILPKFAYGLTVVHNEKINAAQLLEYSRLYRQYDIPCDCMGLEPYWMQEYYDFSTEKKWDPERFYIPYWKPQNTSETVTFFYPLRKMGMQLSLWLCEDYDLFYKEEESMAEKKTAEGFSEDAEILDFHLENMIKYQDTVTKISEPWFEHLKKFVDNGASAFKLDASNQVLEHPDKLWGGKFLDKEVHNVYPVILAKQMNEGFKEHTGRRIMINTSCAYVGTQKYAATWAGDTGGGPKTLVSVMNYSMCGHSNSGCDIDVTSLDAMHYGFLMPWTQQNEWNSWNYPWYLGRELENNYRFYAKLRSSLFPYIYYSAFLAHRDGVPMLRPLLLIHGDSTDRYDGVKNAYMLGDSLLVGAFDMNIPLPEGKWIDYFTGDAYDGGRDIYYNCPQGIGGALFVKAGAVIVTMTPQDYLLEREHEYIVNLYPSKEGGSTSIYEDDGYTYDYETGGYALTEIISSGKAADTLTLTVRARTGGYEGRLDNGHCETMNSIPKISPISAPRDLKIVVHGTRLESLSLGKEEIPFSFDGKNSEFTLCAENRDKDAVFTLRFAK